MGCDSHHLLESSFDTHLLLFDQLFLFFIGFLSLLVSKVFVNLFDLFLYLRNRSRIDFWDTWSRLYLVLKVLWLISFLLIKRFFICFFSFFLEFLQLFGSFQECRIKLSNFINLLIKIQNFIKIDWQKSIFRWRKFYFLHPKINLLNSFQFI